MSKDMPENRDRNDSLKKNTHGPDFIRPNSVVALPGLGYVHRGKSTGKSTLSRGKLSSEYFR